jgi:SAM-dependent methyltransferase
MDGIPLEDNSVDVVICQEGIEHFSDQLFVLKEFNRVLKLGGLMIITTPNYSNIRSRLSYLLNETERYGRMMPPNEIDSVWMTDPNISNEIYCGHIFLLGIQKLRVLARLAGFRIDKINRESIRPTSAILFPFFYPFIYLNAWKTYRRNLKKHPEIPYELKKKVYGESFRLSVHPGILTDGTLFVEFKKELPANEVSATLRGALRNFGEPT